MTVFHGSNQKIEKPSIEFSKNFLDFGRGFYVTTFKNQAEKWALRKASRYRGKAVVNVFDFSDSLKDFKVLQFQNENEKWLDFVCACRKGKEIYKDYDIIIGNVANDDVFKTVDMYFRGLWDKKRTLEELRYYKMNDQICIVNQAVLDKVLVFKESYEVEAGAAK